jgi:hypothetical protein
MSTLQNPVREALAELVRLRAEIVTRLTWGNSWEKAWAAADTALALPAPEPVWWEVIAPNGRPYATQFPADLKLYAPGTIRPLYAEPPAPREPLIELAKRWEQHSEGHAKRSYSAAFSPASAAFTEAARVYEQCATELRMLIADAAPSEIARDAARVTRLEVIDHRKNATWNHDGRFLCLWDVAVQLSYQDDGRTLKVFVNDAAIEQENA